MFLKEVYRHSKWMFAGMLFFAIAHIGVNLKRGMVFSPFFHYGMYSGVYEPKRDYLVNLVTINGDTLRGKDFTPPEWDKLQYSLNQVLASRCDTLFYQNQVRRLFLKAGLEAPSINHYVNKGSVQQRLEQYKVKLAGEYNVLPENVNIVQCRYIYVYDKFIFQEKTDSLTGTNHLCH